MTYLWKRRWNVHAPVFTMQQYQMLRFKPKGPTAALVVSDLHKSSCWPHFHWSLHILPKKAWKKMNFLCKLIKNLYYTLLLSEVWLEVFLSVNFPKNESGCELGVILLTSVSGCHLSSDFCDFSFDQTI